MATGNLEKGHYFMIAENLSKTNCKQMWLSIKGQQDRNDK